MPYKFTETQYSYIKWTIQAVMPAFITCIGVIGGELNWEHTELVMTILGAITTFMATSLGLSSAQYYKDKDNTDE